MACDARLFRRLEDFFGDALLQIGAQVYYKGHDVIPAVLEVDRSLSVLQRKLRSLNPIKQKLRRDMARFFLDGLPEELSQANHSRTRSESRLSQIIREHRT
jgi:hypothetical protein